jgi:hypothetical protein
MLFLVGFIFALVLAGWLGHKIGGSAWYNDRFYGGD